MRTPASAERIVGSAFAATPIRWRDGGLFVAGLVLAVGLHAIDPTEVAMPTCPFRSVTGLACPGCGTLRCLHAILNGDLARATDLNALTVIVLPAIGVVWLLAGFRAFAPHPPTFRLPPAWIGRTLAVGTVLFWVARNLPFEPFRWLAP